MSSDDLHQQFDPGADEEEILHRLQALGPRTSVQHDKQILRSARRAADAIGSDQAPRHWTSPGARSSSWLLPTAMAASFMLGAVVVLVTQGGVGGEPTVTELSIPLTPVTRSANPALDRGSELPVEAADPELWLRYVQELVYNGELELAERHLRRFNELHPDFVLEP